jgi:hypothetical protein
MLLLLLMLMFLLMLLVVRTRRGEPKPAIPVAHGGETEKLQRQGGSRLAGKSILKAMFAVINNHFQKLETGARNHPPYPAHTLLICTTR